MACIKRKECLSLQSFLYFVCCWANIYNYAVGRMFVASAVLELSIPYYKFIAKPMNDTSSTYCMAFLEICQQLHCHFLPVIISMTYDISLTMTLLELAQHSQKTQHVAPVLIYNTVNTL